MVFKHNVLTRYLVYAALVDWLLARTLTRLGIFMPKSPLLISIYQSLTLLGQAAATFAGLLVLVYLLVVASRNTGKGNNQLQVVLPGTLVFVSIFFLLIQPPISLAAFYHILLFTALTATSWYGLRSPLPIETRLAIIFSMLALQAGTASHLVQLLGLQEAGLSIIKAGELMVLLSVLFLWIAFGRPASRRAWFAAALPALAFTIFRLVDPATSGILAIWSTGLTLYLPWPFYSLGLWLGVVTIIACWKKDKRLVEGILLIVSGGFAAQMTSHAFLGLVGLGLIAASPAPGESNLGGEEVVALKAGQKRISKWWHRHTALQKSKSPPIS
jgi:hypothetical protein